MKPFQKRSPLWIVKYEDTSIERGDTLSESREHHMPTKKKRKKYALSDGTLKKLDYLIEQKQEKSKTKVYPCNVLEEVINHAYEIAKVFKN